MKWLYGIIGFLLASVLMINYNIDTMNRLHGNYMNAIVPVYINGCSWAIRVFKNEPVEADFERCKDMARINRSQIEEIMSQVKD